MIRTFSYDAAGNVTDDDRGPGEDYDLTYDDRGRLTRLTKNGLTQTHYSLNGAGERVSKVQAGTTTLYHYDAGGALLAESDDLGNPTTEYIALAGLPLALVNHSGGPATVLRVHADHLGTPQAMTDDLGSIVWERHQRPFGETASQTGTASNDRRFPGQLFDAESGYHYNYFRDYDPSIGRYLQSDPIGLAGGLNTYGYVNANPTMMIDPLGLQDEPGGPGEVIDPVKDALESRPLGDQDLNKLSDDQLRELREELSRQGDTKEKKKVEKEEKYRKQRNKTKQRNQPKMRGRGWPFMIDPCITAPYAPFCLDPNEEVVAEMCSPESTETASGFLNPTSSILRLNPWR